ncbi:FtsK/SpoIIIE domain-containing protein [Frondihabitans cladoniiphilus]|uniref:FtsK/SpoIIIE domain-containing protein n=1 Tax=Frondihabitans cladoniiphilus TaxID=715785 RepID=A0ABP8VLQ6_9MICO
MRLTFTPTSPNDAATAGGAAVHDVVLDAEATVTVGELAEALRVHPDEIAPGADPSTEAASAGVLIGTTLPRTVDELLPVGAVRLEVVGGPFSGDTVGLPAGATVTVGRGDDQLLQILDPFVEAHHATLEVARENATPGTPATMTVSPAADATVVVNGAVVSETSAIGEDDLVQIGSSILRLGRQPARNADVSPEGLGHVAYNRSSRIPRQTPQPAITLPGEKPTSADRTPLPWLSAMLPVVIGVVMAFAFRQPIMLVMAAASPIMVIGNNVTSRRTSKRSGKRTVAKWRDETVAARAAVAVAAESQRVRSWHDDLDPVALTDIATTPTSRLWERRRGEQDALSLRLGVGETPLAASFQGSLSSTRSPDFGVSPAPVTVDLAEGVVGIAGPRSVALDLARTLMIQLAVTRSPRDLHLVLLCDQQAEAEWAFARLLPHLDGEPTALAAIGNTSDTRLARLRELGILLDARRTAAGSRSTAEFDSHVVVFIDQARAYRTLPGMVTLLEHGPSVGIHVVAVEEDRARLPEESATEIVVDAADPTLARVSSVGAVHENVLLDALSPIKAERIARALAPIVHVGGVGDDNLLPASVRFVDLLDVDLDDPQPIAARWSYAPRETRAVVGASADGEFALDLAKDGPHGLVAGTTGAGKSEFLQTLVISLALANRPDALTFVLVDYKGGSAFADCERLPHTVGLVTNLDGRETERALESLDAELKRREHVLKDMGAKDADAAWERDPTTAASRGLARLVLVIDEFAELKTELPDFVDGLVRIARVGRSLGVHLILATQRPSGAITPEMQSNTNLRVALRVTDKGDSTDVLGSPEAASISTSTPGRGYARRGAGAAPAGFQTARVAGRRPGLVHARSSAPSILTRSWRELGVPVVFPARGGAAGAVGAVGAAAGAFGAGAGGAPVDHDDTDLRALVNVIQQASDRIGVGRNPSPWLPPLPSVVTTDDVTVGGAGPAGSVPTVGSLPSVVLGLEDVPSEQAQRPLTWNVESSSHLELIGGARSGRTSTLRALVAQLGATHSPDDLHLYAIDYGNGGLGPMRGLPHCGAVVTPLESGRLERFVSRLGAEIGRRQSVLSKDSYGDIREQRSAASVHDRLPYVVVVLDGWERLASDLGQDALAPFRDAIIRVLREGPAVGIRVVISGDRSLINDKVSAFIDTKYLFPMTDREDYRTSGIPLRGLPAEIGPGRVFYGTPLHEAQMVLLPGGTTGEAQAAAFRAAVAAAVAAATATATATDGASASGAASGSVSGGATGSRSRPFRVDVLPASLTVAESETLPLLGRGTVVGVGGDDLSRYAVDLAENPGFLVVGDRRSGRSTVLALIAEQLAGGGASAARPVAIVATRDSVLRSAGRALGIPLLTDDTLSPDAFEAILAPAREAASGAGAIVLLIDDVEGLKDTPLERAIMDDRGSFTFVVVAHVEEAGGLYKGPFTEAKKARRGMLLSAPAAMNGTQTFGSPLPRQFQGQALPGRAALFWDGSYVEVQVPLP